MFGPQGTPVTLAPGKSITWAYYWGTIMQVGADQGGPFTGGTEDQGPQLAAAAVVAAYEYCGPQVADQQAKNAQMVYGTAYYSYSVRITNTGTRHVTHQIEGGGLS